MDYEVKLDAFQGPLELLYELVKKNKIEISKISLAKITDQYLEYIDHFQKFDLEMASEFMVIAAELIELKAGSLLPDSSEKEDDADPEKRSIVERLQEYRIFKEISEQLKHYYENSADIYFRPQSSYDDIDKEDRLQLEIPSEELRKAFIWALNAVDEDEKEERSLKELDYYKKIEDNIRVQDKVNKIRETIKDSPDAVSFFSFINNKGNRFEIIVTLLSILELIKMKEAKAFQDSLFSEIKIKSG